MAKESRYTDRRRYFNELAGTSEEFLVPYIAKFKAVGEGISVLEIGCGEGGNLLPFARRGCRVRGTDIAPGKIDNAARFFAESGLEGEFACEDFLSCELSQHRGRYDIVILHDVIEHIEPPFKSQFICRAAECLSEGGLMMVAFPAWQMPFGGHQQICRSKVCKALPFMHLLPMKAYLCYLRLFGENEERLREQASIKRSRITVESFTRLVKGESLEIRDRLLWLINPHYKAKFHLPAVKLVKPFSSIPYLRNFFSTSCFFIVGKQCPKVEDERRSGRH